MSDFVLTTSVNAHPALLVPLANGVYHLGRDPSCEIIVVSRSVSRRHARLTIDGGTFLVTDLGSRNGTFIDRTRIAHGRLEPGQLLGLGSVDCRVVPTRTDALASEDEETGGPEPDEIERANAALQSLTRSQRRIATQLMTGGTEKEVARELSLSVHTVHTHIRAIYGRLGVHSRSELLLRLMGQDERQSTAKSGA